MTVSLSTAQAEQAAATDLKEKAILSLK